MPRHAHRPAAFLTTVLNAGLTAALLAVAGCGIEIPTDPDGTLDRVRGGVLRVGVSAQEPWTSALDGGEPAGLEVDLVRGFARSVDADVRWTPGGEHHLVGLLEHGEVDLVIGGLTAKSPWAKQAALTRPYATMRGPDGKSEDRVMAVPLGENAFLVALERYLRDQRPAS